jgi:hypothetical protein
MITSLFGAAPGAIDVDQSAEFLDHSLPKATQGDFPFKVASSGLPARSAGDAKSRRQRPPAIHAEDADGPCYYT